MGFGTPVGKWVAKDLGEPIADLLGSQVARERGLYNTLTIIRDLRKLRSRDTDRDHRVFDAAHRVFRVVQFEVWNKMLKGDAPVCPAH